MNTTPARGNPRGAYRRAVVAVCVALAAWALGAASASAAPAGSIAYIKDGNVFLTRPDGTGGVQVTTSGGYSEVSQADDGTMAALFGERIHKLSRTGAVLADIATPVSDGPPPADPNADHFKGPFMPRISPDGTRIAYAYFWQHFSWDPSCNFSAGCYKTRLESGTAITYSDRLTEWAEFGGPLTGWKWASWIDNDRVVRGDAGVVLAENLVINRIAPGLGHGDMIRWIPHNYDVVGDPTIDRQGKWLAATVKTWATMTWSIQVSRMRPLPEQPEFCFRFAPADTTNLGLPTFSPDATGLAWQEADGIHAMQMPEIPTGTDCSRDLGHPGSLIAPGGSSPSWGPAGVPEAASPESGSAGAGPGSARFVLVTKRLSRSALLRRAAAVRIELPGPGRVTLTLRVGSRVVAKAAARSAGRGVAQLRLRPVPAARSLLRTARGGKLTVAFAPVTGRASTVLGVISFAR